MYENKYEYPYGSLMFVHNVWMIRCILQALKRVESDAFFEAYSLNLV